jgi:hypothetical protein
LDVQSVVGSQIATMVCKGDPLSTMDLMGWCGEQAVSLVTRSVGASHEALLELPQSVAFPSCAIVHGDAQQLLSVRELGGWEAHWQRCCA